MYGRRELAVVWLHHLIYVSRLVLLSRWLDLFMARRDAACSAIQSSKTAEILEIVAIRLFVGLVQHVENFRLFLRRVSLEGCGSVKVLGQHHRLRILGGLAYLVGVVGVGLSLVSVVGGDTTKVRWLPCAHSTRHR